MYHCRLIERVRSVPFDIIIACPLGSDKHLPVISVILLHYRSQDEHRPHNKLPAVSGKGEIGLTINLDLDPTGNLFPDLQLLRNTEIRS